ncbi:MAG: hypothetical protein BGO51_06145 [Rhodospirillales bacterium 69-11]|nr:MAG: hypothetical protein BGO51_06145 [Rhodospirillales bacterium 69-11]
MSDALIERGAWVLDPDTLRWVPKDQYRRAVQRSREARRMRSDLPSPQVMRDIRPFVNVAVDGAEISSRSAKREMMKRHDLIEIGNEKRITKRQGLKRLPSVKNSIKRAVQELS